MRPIDRQLGGVNQNAGRSGSWLHKTDINKINRTIRTAVS